MFKKGQKKRSKKRLKERVAALCDECSRMGEFPLEPLPAVITPLDWDQVPPCLDPGVSFTSGTASARPDTVKGDPSWMNGGKERGLRKRQQCESMLRVLEPMVRSLHARLGRKVVLADCCAGTGNASLAVAFALRDLCQLVAIERCEVAADILKARVNEANEGRHEKLDVIVVTDSVENALNDDDESAKKSVSFDVCMAVHACGYLTDVVLEACARRKLPFVVCPCCVGKLQNKTNQQVPRSKWLREERHVDEKSYLEMARIADHSSYDFDDEKHSTERRAKSLLEIDRLAAMLEQGFEGHWSKLEPPSASPKNDILFGQPKF